jgi:hypothetical protein
MLLISEINERTFLKSSLFGQLDFLPHKDHIILSHYFQIIFLICSNYYNNFSCGVKNENVFKLEQKKKKLSPLLESSYKVRIISMSSHSSPTSGTNLIKTFFIVSHALTDMVKIV